MTGRNLVIEMTLPKLASTQNSSITTFNFQKYVFKSVNISKHENGHYSQKFRPESAINFRCLSRKLSEAFDIIFSTRQFTLRTRINGGIEVNGI